MIAVGGAGRGFYLSSRSFSEVSASLLNHWIICHAVLPHFVDNVGVLCALRRCLAPDGTLVICHASSRETINTIHQQAGGAVAQDRLPDLATLAGMLRQAGLHPVQSVDGADRQVVIARPYQIVPDFLPATSV